jgi:hypothetical protein
MAKTTTKASGKAKLAAKSSKKSTKATAGKRKKAA